MLSSADGGEADNSLRTDKNTLLFITLKAAISHTQTEYLPGRHGTVVWYTLEVESCLASVVTH